MLNECFILNNYVKGKPIISVGSLCNSSYIKINDSDYISGREANYTFINPKYMPNTYNVIKDGNFFWTNNNLYEEKNEKFIKSISIHPEYCNVGYCGLEDFRFIKWNKIIYGFCTEPSMYSGRITGEISMFEFSKELNLENRKRCKTNQMTEKNWQPIEDKPFNVVYSHKPFTILNVSNMEFSNIPENNCEISYSGSTPILRYKNGWLSLVHKRDKNKYVHFFIRFDENFRIIKISKEFSFFGVDVEFCTGMKIEENNVRLLASINDTLTFNFSLSFDLIEKIFNNELTDNKTNENMYNDFLKYAILCKNNLGIAAFMTWCTDRTLMEESLCLENPIIEKNPKLKQIYMNRYKEMIK